MVPCILWEMKPPHLTGSRDSMGQNAGMRGCWCSGWRAGWNPAGPHTANTLLSRVSAFPPHLLIPPTSCWWRRTIIHTHTHLTNATMKMQLFLSSFLIFFFFFFPEKYIGKLLSRVPLGHRTSLVSGGQMPSYTEVHAWRLVNYIGNCKENQHEYAFSHADTLRHTVSYEWRLRNGQMFG